MADHSKNIVEPWFTWQSPWPDLPQVTLDRQRWEEHIISEHSYLTGKEGKVASVIENASHVFEGAKTAGSANPDYVVFLNSEVIASSGSPLIAIVSPQTGQLRTALYHRSYRDYSGRKPLWSK